MVSLPQMVDDMASFHLYKPQIGQQKSSLRACEACYTRKVRCDTGGHNTACANCVAHGADCRVRTRKRKAASISNDGVVAGNNAGEQAGSPMSRHIERAGRKRIVERRDSQSMAVSPPYLFITYQPSPAPISSPDAFHNSSFLSRTAILGD